MEEAMNHIPPRVLFRVIDEMTAAGVTSEVQLARLYRIAARYAYFDSVPKRQSAREELHEHMVQFGVPPVDIEYLINEVALQTLEERCAKWEL